MIVPIVPVVSKNVQTIGTIIWKRYPDDRKRPGRLRRPRSLGTSCVLSRRSGRSCKFCSDQMETLSEDWSPWHQVFEEILCLQGTLLASQCRKIKRKSGYQGTRFALRIKIIHLCGLFAKHAQKSYCLTQRHRWRLTTPRLLPLRRSRRSYGHYQSSQSSSLNFIRLLRVVITPSVTSESTGRSCRPTTSLLLDLCFYSCKK